jgi:hypothetical protein
MLATVVDTLRDLDDLGLTDEFRRLELERRRVEAELAAIVAEGQRRSIHVVDHHHSMTGWLKANANYSTAQCTRLRRLARLVDDVPAVGDALNDGRIGTAQADELARVRSNPRCGDQLADSIEVLLEQAEQLSFDDARTCLRRWEILADLDGAHADREASVANRSATVVDLDGTLYLRATGGDRLATAEMVAIFNAELEREFQVDVAERTRVHGSDAPASALPRTDSQRRYDAMHSIFLKSVTAPADGRTPAPLVNILVDQRTHEEGLAAHGLVPFPKDLPDSDLAERRCDTETGTVLLPDDIVRASLLGHVRRVVMNSAGVVIEMGRKQRLFTGAARDAAKLMATTCDHPGCGVSVTFAQVDHMVEWSENGVTDPENSSIACGRHNPTKHSHYRVKRTDRGYVVYHRRDGTPMLATGRRHPDELPETDDQLTSRLAQERVTALRPAS